jgi:hypothetical protein
MTIRVPATAHLSTHPTVPVFTLAMPDRAGASASSQVRSLDFTVRP